MMKGKIILLIFIVLLAIVISSCTISELSWANRENDEDPLRQLIGLPSIAIGNLNPAARNPSLEILCTGLYDTPGGYCNYFTDGVPYFDSPIFGNLTAREETR